jgi:hypothetical protein
LTSFALSNWVSRAPQLVFVIQQLTCDLQDFPPIKFIIENFQENYPESLGALIFYNAPWIFSGLSTIQFQHLSRGGPCARTNSIVLNTGFWKLIRTILDPVVAAKVHFLSGAKGLEQLISREHIIKELGGDEDWEYDYVEPRPHENDKLHDTETRNVILAERKKLGDDLFSLTSEWISNPQVDSLSSSRNEVITHLRDNYWTLDPYVRARTILDRTGVIKGRGKVDFYPAAEAQPEEAPIQPSEEPKAMVEHVDDTRLTAVAA